MGNPTLEDTSACEWEESHVEGESCSHFGEATITQCIENHVWDRAGVEYCKQEGFRAVRFGPFTSEPGKWVSVTSKPLLGLLENGQRIKGFFGAATTADGTRIGFPPLHMHHIHVAKGDLARGTSRHHADHWFETHGDYSVGADFGVGAQSTLAYIRHLPEGYCYLVNSAEDVDVNAEVNDVRLTDKEVQVLRASEAGSAARTLDGEGDASGSPTPSASLARAPDGKGGGGELQYYVTLAWQLASEGSEQRLKPMQKFWFRHPQSLATPDDIWARYDAPNRPSVTWWSGTMPSDGRMLQSWMHSHRNRESGLLLIASSPDEMGFNCGELGIEPPGDSKQDVALVKDLAHTMLELKRRGKVVCESDTALETLQPISGHLAENIADDSYDRHGGLKCGEWNFKKGDPWFIAAFNSPKTHPEKQHVPQHTELWMYVDLDGETTSYSTTSPEWRDSPFHTNRANVCPDAAATGAPGRLHTFSAAAHLMAARLSASFREPPTQSKVGWLREEPGAIKPERVALTVVGLVLGSVLIVVSALALVSRRRSRGAARSADPKKAPATAGPVESTRLLPETARGNVRV